MAVSPEEALNPERFAEILWYWEERIDNFLKENYIGLTEPMMYKSYDRKQPNAVINIQVVEILLKKYKKAGWKVSWDKDLTAPWFTFRYSRKLHP